MPIKPENKNRYPDNWNEIRWYILERAKNRCEWCGARNNRPHPVTGSMVVLTVAHMDHVPENCDPDNLRALCQRCHNRYDAAMRAWGRRYRVTEGQLEVEAEKLIEEGKNEERETKGFERH